MKAKTNLSNQTLGRCPVVVVIPPLFMYNEPTLASGILKASVEQSGLRCTVLYANLLFAQRIGFVLHDRLILSDLEDLFGERIFARYAHPEIESMAWDDNQHNRRQPEGNEHPWLPGDPVRLTGEECSRAEAECEAFLAEVVDRIIALGPKVVGFSSTFQQTNAAIAIARRLKDVAPDMVLVIGGSNCGGEIGEEIGRSIDAFDYVFQGEADFAFAQFCHEVVRQGKLPAQKLITCPPQMRMDDIPIPDYSDFIDQGVVPLEDCCLNFESSRGCWWGQKHHCTFCGLNGSYLGFRVKRPEQVKSEVCELKRKYPRVRQYHATDLIAPHEYHRSGFPQFTAEGEDLEIFYEIKANTTFDQLLAMRVSGVTEVQPGIESFSAEVLRSMDKGCSPAMNVRILRDCDELSITPVWNLLIDIPGDTIGNYEEQIRLLPLLQHLCPPAGVVPVCIQRFSPYHFAADRFQIRNLRPARGYYLAFPDAVDRKKIAYFFAAEYPSAGRERPELGDALRRLVLDWRERWASENPARLDVRKLREGVWAVFDTRDCAVSAVQVLDLEEYALIRYCRVPQLRSELNGNDRLPQLLDLHFLVEVDNRVVSLVCEPDQLRNLRQQKLAGQRKLNEWTDQQL